MNDEGAAAVWAAWVAAALMALAGSILVLGAAASARHRSGSAADLAALAAAAYGPWGERYACEQARWVTDRMGVRLTACRMTGWIAQVEAAAAISGLATVTARARAGPADPLGPAEENAGPAAGSGRPRAVSGITDGPSRSGERYRRPVDVRLERRPGFTRRSLTTSCRRVVTPGGGCAV